MREIKVEDMYECPFKGQEGYSLSDRTGGVDDICLLLDGSFCELKPCPLKKAGKIIVIWAKK